MKCTLIVLLVLVLAIVACSGAPVPTATLYPTNTPYPTQAPPTETPEIVAVLPSFDQMDAMYVEYGYELLSFSPRGQDGCTGDVCYTYFHTSYPGSMMAFIFTNVGETPHEIGFQVIFGGPGSGGPPYNLLASFLPSDVTLWLQGTVYGQYRHETVDGFVLEERWEGDGLSGPGADTYNLSIFRLQ